MRSLQLLSYNKFKMIIENFKLKDFLKQDAKLIKKYVVALQFLPSVQTNREIFHLKLKYVEFIKKNINSVNDETLIEIIAIVQGIRKGRVYELPIIKFFAIAASAREQIERISRAEETSLAPSEMNLKWIAVDGDKKMSKFGIYNTLEALSGGDALKYKDYMDMEYSEVFTILYMRKTAAELQKEMDAIKLKTD